MRFLLFFICLGLLPDCSAGDAPTFYRDVLPVLAERCQTCHRTGEAAPMPLMTYADARPWAKAIRDAVLTRRMPPWHADSSVARYRNDLSCTEAQRQTLIAWANAGAPAGRPGDAPKSKVFVTGWRIAEPDAVFEMPETFSVPSTGTLDYQYYAVPTGFSEDKWVEMAEVRPSARSVVHHAIVSVRAPGDYGWYGSQFLAGYAPGAAPQIWKPGTARLVPAGSYLIFQMHYTTNGKPVRDRTQIGLVFATRAPTERVLAMRASNAWFAIPPRAARFPVKASTTLRQPVRLAAIRPHMHLRGTAFEVRLVFPDGTTKLVLNVPRYDFHWQPYYYFEAPIDLPAGTRIECTGFYDNSANNPLNPDPNAEVRWGEQSWDEMLIGWLDVLVPVASTRLTSSR